MATESESIEMMDNTKVLAKKGQYLADRLQPSDIIVMETEEGGTFSSVTQP